MNPSKVIRRTVEEIRAELESVYRDFPALRGIQRECCQGCAENEVAHRFGWGPYTDAWWRVEELRYLLGEDR